MMECSYKDIEWCQSAFHNSDECFCDGNIIVPDSMDDIAKIISVKAHGCVSDVKSEDGRIVISGQVKFSVLYIGEGENSICPLISSVPFSHIIPAEGITDDFLSIVNITSCCVNYSLINSRRLKTAANLKFSAASYKNHRMKLLMQATGAQVKEGDIALSSVRAVCQKNIVITDNSPLPAGKGAIVKLLRQSAKISDKDFKVLNNKLIIKGNILASVLYLTEDNITDAKITIPFTEVVEVEGITPSFDTLLTLTVSDCDIKADTDLSGEYKMLDSSIILNVAIVSHATQSMRAVSDIYLPGSAVKTESVQLLSNSVSHEHHDEEFIKDTLTLSNGMPTLSRVIDIDCTVTDTSISDDCINSNCEVTLMYTSNDQSINTFSTKLTFAHKTASKSPVTPCCTIKHIGYAITSPDSIEVRIGADFAYLSNQADSLTAISSCEEVEYTPQSRPSVIVSFVNIGDSLWDIAKKYNISLSSLASANAIDENAILTVGDKLIIPR